MDALYVHEQSTTYMQLFYADCDHIMCDPAWPRTYDAILSSTQLTLGEQVRVKSLRDPTHQARQAISFVAQQYALAMYAGAPQQIIREPNTKPRCGDSAYHFNTSHSGKHVVVCVDTMPCGVDIECVGVGECSTPRHISQYPQIVYDVFGVVNQIPIHQFHPPEKAVRLWTQTEAWLKFVGMGLRGLDDVGVECATNGFSLTHHGFSVPPHHDISDLLPENVFGTVFTDRMDCPVDSISCMNDCVQIH
jgi:phosphopantetheinyl transferase